MLSEGVAIESMLFSVMLSVENAFSCAADIRLQHSPIAMVVYVFFSMEILFFEFCAKILFFVEISQYGGIYYLFIRMFAENSNLLGDRMMGNCLVEKIN